LISLQRLSHEMMPPTIAHTGPTKSTLGAKLRHAEHTVCAHEYSPAMPAHAVSVCHGLAEGRIIASVAYVHAFD
jgi:hypothetical protein